MDISKHTLLNRIYEHGRAIEELPCSELQTKISVQNSEIAREAERLIDALRDALIPYRDDTEKVLVTEERMEAWRQVAETAQ